MKLLFVADGRSPTTINWLQYWIERGYDIHLLSTFPCEKIPGLSSLYIFPVAFSKYSGKQVKSGGGKNIITGITGNIRGILRILRYYIGPPSLFFYKRKFQNLVSKLQPDLVHALRIPFEGMLAANTPGSIPLVISIWGNDITLHAQGSFLMAWLTRNSLARANALFADTYRDVELGKQWGFGKIKPTLVVPGSGGIRTDLIFSDHSEADLPEEIPNGHIIVNPRGQRPGSLRQDVFFRSIPKILAKVPNAFFICPSLMDDEESENFVRSLRIQSNVRLWPRLTQAQLRSLFRKAEVYVSPSVHDGTPNSLLEAIAYGCYPVVGNIESMQEWIQSDVNGALVDANTENSIAEAIINAINQPDLRLKAAKINASLIADRAEYTKNMKNVENFYKMLMPIR